MKLRITSDANAESGVGQVVDEISGPTYQHFVSQDYGGGLLGVAVVLMCRDPELNFKRRLRFAKKERTLFMDVMLDLGELRHADHERRKRIVVERLVDEITAIVRKYSVVDFDQQRFLSDMKSWLAERRGSV